MSRSHWLLSSRFRIICFSHTRAPDWSHFDLKHRPEPQPGDVGEGSREPTPLLRFLPPKRYVGHVAENSGDGQLTRFEL